MPVQSSSRPIASNSHDLDLKHPILMMLLAVFLGLLTCNKSKSARASPSQRQRTKPLQGLAAQRCRAAEPATTEEEEEEEERSHVDRDLPFFDVFPDSRIP